MSKPERIPTRILWVRLRNCSACALDHQAWVAAGMPRCSCPSVPKSEARSETGSAGLGLVFAVPGLVLLAGVLGEVVSAISTVSAVIR